MRWRIITTARVLRQDEALACDRPTMLLEEAASYWDYPPDPAVDCLRVREAVSPPVQVAAYQPAQAVDYLRAQAVDCLQAPAAVNPQDQVTIGEPSACRNR